jgi:hypothetical protein
MDGSEDHEEGAGDLTPFLFALNLNPSREELMARIIELSASPVDDALMKLFRSLGAVLRMTRYYMTAVLKTKACKMMTEDDAVSLVLGDATVRVLSVAEACRSDVVEVAVADGASVFVRGPLPPGGLAEDALCFLVPEARRASFARFVIPTLQEFAKELQDLLAEVRDASLMHATVGFERLQNDLATVYDARVRCPDIVKELELGPRSKIARHIADQRSRKPPDIPFPLWELMLFVSMHLQHATPATPGEKPKWLWAWPDKCMPHVKGADGRRWRCGTPSCVGYHAADLLLKVQTELFHPRPGFHVRLSKVLRTMTQVAKAKTAGFQLSSSAGSCAGGGSAVVVGGDVAVPAFSELPQLSTAPNAREAFHRLLAMVPTVPVVRTYTGVSISHVVQESHQDNAMRTFVAAEERGVCLLQRLALVPSVTEEEMMGLVRQLEDVERANRVVVDLQRKFSLTLGVVELSDDGAERKVQPSAVLRDEFLAAFAVLQRALVVTIAKTEALLERVRDAAYGLIVRNLMPAAQASDREFRLSVVRKTVARLERPLCRNVFTLCPSCPTMVEDLTTMETSMVPESEQHGEFVQTPSGEFRCVVPGCADPTAIQEVLTGMTCDACSGAAFVVSGWYNVWYCTCKKAPIATTRTATALIQKDFAAFRRVAEQVRAGTVPACKLDAEVLSAYYDGVEDKFREPYTSIVNDDSIAEKVSYLHGVHLEGRLDMARGARHDLVVKPCNVIECSKCRTPVVLPTQTRVTCMCLKTLTSSAPVTKSVSQETGSTMCTRCGLVAATEVLSEGEDRRTFLEDGVDNRHSAAPADMRLTYLPSTQFVVSPFCTRDDMMRVWRLSQSLDPMWGVRGPKSVGTTELTRDQMKKQVFDIVDWVVEDKAQHVSQKVAEVLKTEFSWLREAEKVKVFDQVVRMLVKGVFETYLEAKRLPPRTERRCEACGELLPRGPLGFFHRCAVHAHAASGTAPPQTTPACVKVDIEKQRIREERQRLKRQRRCDLSDEYPSLEGC